jgi:hypothetical protein
MFFMSNPITPVLLNFTFCKIHFAVSHKLSTVNQQFCPELVNNLSGFGQVVATSQNIGCAAYCHYFSSLSPVKLSITIFSRTFVYCYNPGMQADFNSRFKTHFVKHQFHQFGI